MNKQSEIFFEAFIKNSSGATGYSINRLQSQIYFEIPQEYLDLMKLFNGGEGPIGKNSWLCLFPVEDLLSINHNYGLLMDQIPDYFLFAKDSADTGYAFHKRDNAIYSFGLMSDFRHDPIEKCAFTFTDFIKYLFYQ